MSQPSHSSASAFESLGARGIASILWRYFREKAVEQLRSVWFIIAYLLLFQVFVLQLPIIYGVTIALGIFFVVIGLTFFMEGLRLGLMPFGETIGAILPRNSKLPVILGFAFLLGLGATFAEPAISVLKKAGGGVSPDDAPLLYSLLNDFSGQLVLAVGVGIVTLASLLPILAVLSLAFYHHLLGDYYGTPGYRGAVVEVVKPDETLTAVPLTGQEKTPPRFTQEEFETYLKERKLPSHLKSYETQYVGGKVVLEDGRIVHRGVEILPNKVEQNGVIEDFVISQTRLPWDYSLQVGQELWGAFQISVQAILPLCIFKFLTLVVILKEKLRKRDEIVLGIVFAMIGMALFSLGLTMGLTPLRTQLGSNVPVTFASIIPFGRSGTVPALFQDPTVGKVITMLFHSLRSDR